MSTAEQLPNRFDFGDAQQRIYEMWEKADRIALPSKLEAQAQKLRTWLGATFNTNILEIQPE